MFLIIISSVIVGLKGAKKKRLSFTTYNPANQTDNMTMLSFHRSPKAVERGPVNYCVWPEARVGAGDEKACLMTNTTPSSMLVFSLFEKQTFLGQVGLC
jgi:hypothetical protein